MAREPLTPGRTVVVPFAAMPSACPTGSAQVANRLDPYWAGVWTVGSTARWLSLSTALRRERMGLACRSVGESAWSRESATERLLSGGRRQRRLSHVAGVNLWRTMTTEQLAAMTGSEHLTARASREVDLMFAAGLVQKGAFVMEGRSRRLPTLLRPDPVTGLGDLGPALTYAEWVGVTAGQPWRWGSQFDRHNLLATELGLRIAELCDVAAVFGEALGAMDVLTRTGDPALASRAADAVVVRRDGLRIALEVTANTGAAFTAKVARWARALAQDRTGSLVVLFVEAAHPDLDGRGRSSIENVMRRDLAKGARRDMSSALSRVWERMFVASWRDWFPAPGQVLRAFGGLPARRAVGVTHDGTGGWETLDLLDPFGYQFDGDDPDSQALLVNANTVLGQPHWLRKDSRKALLPGLEAAMLAHAGVTEVPVLPMVRPGQHARRPG